MITIDPSRIHTREELTEQLVGLFHQGGWSIHRLAAAADLSPATVQSLINGTTGVPRSGTLKAFVTACGQPIRPWLEARGRVVESAQPSQPSRAQLLAQLDVMQDRAERAEAALEITGRSPDQVIRELTSARLQDLADRDPVAGDHENGHLYLIVHPVSGRDDALLDLLGASPSSRLDAAVRGAVEARGGQEFSPDLDGGGWQRCSDGFISTRGINDTGRIREDSLLEVLVQENGGVNVLCGRGVTHMRSPWRRLGPINESEANEQPMHRVVIPPLVIGLTHGALALAGTLCEDTGYRDKWQIGLRLEGLHGAVSFEYVREGDEDTVRPYDRNVYERTACCDTNELLEKPGVITKQIVAPLLRGLAIDRLHFRPTAS